MPDTLSLFIDVTNNSTDALEVSAKDVARSMASCRDPALVVAENDEKMTPVLTSESSSLASASTTSSTPHLSMEPDDDRPATKRARFESPTPEQKEDAPEKTPKSDIALVTSSDAASSVRRCLQCNATKTSYWRTGPKGSKTLCNACGIKYGKNLAGGVSGRRREGARKASSSSSSRPKSNKTNKSKNNINSASSSSDSASPTPVAAKATSSMVWKKESLRDRKVFLTAGLYSGSTERHGAPFRVPPPLYFGELLIDTEQEFELPIDIVEDYLNGRLFDFGEQRTNKPNRYIRLLNNAFTERKARREDHGGVCQCTPPSDRSKLGCGENCLNRMMFYECNPNTCPCGDQCSNQRFRKREFVKGLKVVKTDGRGWGLCTPHAIKQGTLITEYRGEVVSVKTYEERMRTVYKYQHNFYFLDYHKGEVLDAFYKGSEARFINHGCDPNCQIEKWSRNGEFHMGVFAIKDIEANSELFYDYNFDLYDTKAMGQKCQCGGANCRGYVGKRPPSKK